MVQIISVIPLKVPCFLVKTSAGFFLIDTGDPSERVKLIQSLDQAGVQPGNLKIILLTHGDFDHSGNAAFLQKRYATQVAMHADDVEMVKSGNQGWNRKEKSDRVTRFGRLIIFVSTHLIHPARFDTFTPDLFIDEGKDLSAYGFDARVLHLPGHSKGSIGLLTASGDLFCGDLLMNMFKPDLHFMIDDLTDFEGSMRKLAALEIRTIYPGHGKPFSKEQLLKIDHEKSWRKR
jgi:hydroxyacylglutathione hydrolase